MEKRTIDSLTLGDMEKMKNDLVMRGIVEDFLNKESNVASSEDKDDWTIHQKYCIDKWWLNEPLNDSRDFKFSELDSLDYNIFESKEEALKWAKKINAMNKLRLIANHLNGDWAPDWSNVGEEKWFISFDPEVERYLSDSCYNIKYNEIAFKDDDSATKAINLMGQESLDDLFA